MKFSVSYRDVEHHQPIEKECDRAVAKLKTLLKTYDPDLVQLHAVFSKAPRSEDHALALTLTLPTGSLHATASNQHIRATCKKAFHEIETQVKKHQARLRKDYEWKRKRTRDRVAAAFS